ncbi:MAG: hypothetical protein EOO39_46130 [Cytophagaceae bacterium]|nr:MAG: hypothetical protein EOO39_46130 [Cytophagaceae bacterium]
MKDKAEQRAEAKIDAGIERGLDEAEDSIDGKKTSSAENNDEKGQSGKKEVPATSTTGFQSYSSYDFVPGENVVYAEDFSQDAIGLIGLATVYDQVVPAKDAPLVRGHGDLVTSLKQLSLQALVMRRRVDLVDHYIRACVLRPLKKGRGVSRGGHVGRWLVGKDAAPTPNTDFILKTDKALPQHGLFKQGARCIQVPQQVRQLQLLGKAGIGSQQEEATEEATA